MHAEDFLVNQCGNRQTVKDIREDLPESDGVPAFALVVESINAVDLRALVIPTQQEEVLWVLDLVAHEKAYRFD
jgi:hypothetical protein